MRALPAPLETRAPNCASDLQRCSRRRYIDHRCSTSMNSTHRLTTPACSTRGTPTSSASADSSRGRSVPLKTPSDLEVTAIGRLHIATPATARDDRHRHDDDNRRDERTVTSRSQSLTTTIAACLLHHRRATPTAPSSRPSGPST
jgi:hypothetical protein